MEDASPSAAETLPAMNHTQAVHFVNHGALALLLDSIVRVFQPINKILLVTPNYDDRYFIKTLFPDSLICITDIFTWDLDNLPPKYFPRFDLAISSNVLMYSHYPEKWITHILSIANLYVFQDLKYRKRSLKSPHLGVDGDSIRYTLISESTKQPSFALSGLQFSVCKYFEFEGVKNEYHNNDDPPIHICAAIAAPHKIQSTISVKDRLFAVKQDLQVFTGKNLRRLSRRLHNLFCADGN